MKRLIFRAVTALAVLGIGLVGYRVVPAVWVDDPIAAAIVAMCLFYVAMSYLEDLAA